MASKKSTSSKPTTPKQPEAKQTPVTKRTPKRQWRWFDTVVVVFTMSLVGYGLGHNSIAKPADDGPCREPGITETVNLSNDSFSRQDIQLNRCDRLRVVNSDSSLSYDIAFGVHDEHVEYPGFTPQQLRPNEYLELDAVEAGQFTLHDHLRDKAQLRLEISER
jgi:hypothetical protein